MQDLLQNTLIAFSDGLPRASATSVGIDAAAIERLIDDIEGHDLELHNLMVWRNGAVVAEGFHWPYRPDRRRMTHSLTKSVLACAIGMLIDDGRLSLDDHVIDYFPEVTIDPAGAAARITVDHLLTMRVGHGEEVSGSIWRSIETSWIDEFFRIPIVYEPGTEHVYTSAASYMLSAIVTRITGQTTFDYLKPRLFDPLGITNVTWDIGPDGVNPGGNGISFTTADALKLAILHVQGGVWNGKRLLSEAWVAAATETKGPFGYGFHWVVGDGYYAALGVLVQMAIAYPAHNMVIAINCAMKESAVVLPHLKRHVPDIVARAGGAEADARLETRLARWSDAPAITSDAPDASASLAGDWNVAPNDLGITALHFTISPTAIELKIDDDRGGHHVTIGRDRWIEAPSALPGAALHHGYYLIEAPTMAGAHWVSPAKPGTAELHTTWHFVESSFRDSVVIVVDGDRLTFNRSVNMNSSVTVWPELTATRA